MDKVNSAILDILTVEKRVTIPEVGSLIRRDGSDEIVFIDLLKKNDGKLLRAIQQKYSANENEALKILEEYIVRLNHDIHHYGEFVIDGIGRLNISDGMIVLNSNSGSERGKSTAKTLGESGQPRESGQTRESGQPRESEATGRGENTEIARVGMETDAANIQSTPQTVTSHVAETSKRVEREQVQISTPVAGTPKKVEIERTKTDTTPSSPIEESRDATFENQAHHRPSVTEKPASTEHDSLDTKERGMYKDRNASEYAEHSTETQSRQKRMESAERSMAMDSGTEPERSNRPRYERNEMNRRASTQQHQQGYMPKRLKVNVDRRGKSRPDMITIIAIIAAAIAIGAIIYGSFVNSTPKFELEQIESPTIQDAGETPTQETGK